MAEKKYSSYKELPVYREADKQMRREIEEFVKKYHPSNDEMYLQLKRYELKNLDSLVFWTLYSDTITSLEVRK